MNFRFAKNTKRVIAAALMCSALLCNFSNAEASTVSLKDYNGTVVATFSNHNTTGSYSGIVHVAGVKANIKVRVEAYYFNTASDRNKRKNVIFYEDSYTHYGYCAGAGGRSITYPLCNSKYPCQAFANVNGSFQGKAVVTD